MTTRIPTTVTLFQAKDGHPYISLADATTSDGQTISRVLAITGKPAADKVAVAANGAKYAVLGRVVLVGPAFNTRVRDDGTTVKTLIGCEGIVAEELPADVAEAMAVFGA